MRPGAGPPLSEVREAVLALPRRKGMVIDPCDPDSVSAGSFFLNPILSPERFAALERRVTKRFGETVRPPAWPEVGGWVKTSAEWLIERAGFHRGYGDGRVGNSQKHALVLINRGGATTTELVALARALRTSARDMSPGCGPQTSAPTVRGEPRNPAHCTPVTSVGSRNALFRCQPVGFQAMPRLGGRSRTAAPHGPLPADPTVPLSPPSGRDAAQVDGSSSALSQRHSRSR